MSYEFLKEPKDKNKNGIDHPDYDPTTLYVPSDFKKTLTPVRSPSRGESRQRLEF